MKESPHRGRILSMIQSQQGKTDYEIPPQQFIIPVILPSRDSVALERFADSPTDFTCKGRGVRLVWEVSPDGMRYTQIPSTDSHDTYGWARLHSESARPNGILESTMRVQPVRNWYDQWPYVYLRCKALGYPPFASHSFSQPIEFVACKYIV